MKSASVEILDLARRKLGPSSVIDLVGWDPGVNEYATVFDKIIADGSKVIFQPLKVGTRPSSCKPQMVFKTFAFTETIGLNFGGHLSDPRRIWFRILTNSCHIVACLNTDPDDYYEPGMHWPIFQAWFSILVDSSTVQVFF